MVLPPLLQLYQLWPKPSLSLSLTDLSILCYRCYIATASPAKFQAVVERAGLNFDPPEAVRALDNLATRYQNLERSADWCKDWEERLREKIRCVGSSRQNTGTPCSWLLEMLLWREQVLLQNPWHGCGGGQLTAARPWPVYFLVWFSKWWSVNEQWMPLSLCWTLACRLPPI